MLLIHVSEKKNGFVYDSNAWKKMHQVVTYFTWYRQETSGTGDVFRKRMRTARAGLAGVALTRSVVRGKLYKWRATLMANKRVHGPPRENKSYACLLVAMAVFTALVG